MTEQIQTDPGIRVRAYAAWRACRIIGLKRTTIVVEFQTCKGTGEPRTYQARKHPAEFRVSKAALADDLDRWGTRGAALDRIEKSYQERGREFPEPDAELPRDGSR